MLYNLHMAKIDFANLLDFLGVKSEYHHWRDDSFEVDEPVIKATGSKKSVFCKEVGENAFW